MYHISQVSHFPATLVPKTSTDPLASLPRHRQHWQSSSLWTS